MPETPATTENPLEQLTQNVQFLKGVGPARAEKLKKLGIETAADLLFFFPRKYQDFTQQHLIAEMEDDQLVSVVGVVDDIDHQLSGNGRHILYVLIKQENQFLRAVWFNQAYLTGKFKRGQRVMFQGKVKKTSNRFQMTHPRITWIDAENSAVEAARLVPTYRLTDGVNQRQITEIVAQAVETFTPLVEEAMSEQLRKRAQLCGIQDAIRQIHSPANQEEADQARKRLVYQELFILQLALAIRRHRVRSRMTAPQMELTPKIKSRMLGRMPFELTPSQSRTLQEIGDDLNRPYPMNRLLHGEVGSGKTAVAVCAMMLAVAHGFQAGLMAPTEVLARQHFRTLTELLAGSRVQTGLLTGSIKGKDRKRLLEQISSGETDIVIGTQAVANQAATFKNLGLVVIDEQHKFGVKQRALMRESEREPHYLVMTATPIPRTVSMTLFGDLDVSILDKPVGVGTVVHTYLGEESARDKWWEFFRKKLRDGRQGYVVAPLVSGDDDSKLSSVEQMYEGLTNGPLEEFRLDLMHGRQSADEKEIAMRAFADGKTQVMVATSVVEVGINVPNATVMTIESAERFGLSQLHQLRGRVSRGKHQGYVCAYSSTDDPIENKRLAAFAETNDGFKLAETDLQLRGPGNLFSTEQTGFPPLMIADLVADQEILLQTHQDARLLIDENPELENEKFERLRKLVFARYGKALDLSDVA